MNTLKFKTNINCSGCVAKVTPALNEVAGENNWKVDTDNPEKVLTIENAELSAEQVEETIKKTGFKIETING